MEWLVFGGIALVMLLANKKQLPTKTTGGKESSSAPKLELPASDNAQQVLDTATKSVTALTSVAGALGLSGAATIGAGALVGAGAGHLFAQATKDIDAISGIDSSAVGQSEAGQLAMEQAYDIVFTSSGAVAGATVGALIVAGSFSVALAGLVVVAALVVGFVIWDLIVRPIVEHIEQMKTLERMAPIQDLLYEALDEVHAKGTSDRLWDVFDLVAQRFQEGRNFLWNMGYQNCSREPFFTNPQANYNPPYLLSHNGLGVGWFQEWDIGLDAGHKIRNDWLKGTGHFRTFWYQSWRYKDSVIRNADAGRDYNPSWKPEILLPETITFVNSKTGEKTKVYVAESLAETLKVFANIPDDTWYQWYVKNRLAGIVSGDGSLVDWKNVLYPATPLDLHYHLTKCAMQRWEYIFGDKGDGAPWLIKNARPGPDGKFEKAPAISDDVVEFLGSKPASPVYAPYQRLKKLAFDLVERFNSDPKYRSFMRYEAQALYAQRYSSFQGWKLSQLGNLRPKPEAYEREDIIGYSKADFDASERYLNLMAGVYPSAVTADYESQQKPAVQTAQVTAQASDIKVLEQQATAIQQSFNPINFFRR